MSSIFGNSPGCNTSEEIIASCTVSNKEPDRVNTFQVIPNPVDQYIELKGLNDHRSIQFSIVDMLGNRVYQGNQDNTTINIQILPAGVYSAVIHVGDTNYSSRFIKF